jgi:hypothetical protein
VRPEIDAMAPQIEAPRHASDLRTCFENIDGNAGSGQGVRRCQARGACTDHRDAHRLFLMLSSAVGLGKPSNWENPCADIVNR